MPCDYKRAGQITDDELFKILVKDLPEGCKLTAVMDCCHSGTGLDLPYDYQSGRGWRCEDVPFHTFSCGVLLFSSRCSRRHRAPRPRRVDGATRHAIDAMPHAGAARAASSSPIGG